MNYNINSVIQGLRERKNVMNKGMMINIDLTLVLKWVVIYFIVAKVIGNAEQLGKLFH